jgi:dephospho-CoA kinase
MARDSPTKGQLQEVGWEVMGGGMQSELNLRLIGEIKAGTDVAVDGLRHPLDFESLTNSFPSSFQLLYIDSPPKERFERLNRLGRYVDFSSFDASDSHPVEQQIESLRGVAAVVVPNDRSLQDFYEALDELLQGIRKVGQT